MDHMIIQAQGWLLALSAVLFGVAHSIVVTTPAHPDFQMLRTIIRGRELVLVPCSILLLSFPGLFGSYQLSLLGMITSVSLLMTFFLLLIAPQLRKLMNNRIEEINAVRSDPRPASPATLTLMNGGGSESLTEAEVSEGALGPALAELRDQRRVQQVLWDLPVAVVLVDQDLRVQSRSGGLVRNHWFPNEFAESGASLPEVSPYRTVAMGVIRTHKRNCFESTEDGQHIQVCASPWVSMSGKIRGVAFMITCFHDRLMTDESEVRFHA